MDQYVEYDAMPPEYAEHARRTARESQRRIALPLVLFALTCLSTLFVGGARMNRDGEIEAFNTHDGLTYMVCVMGILLAHEMGHFLQAVRYGVPASLPFFIPMPFTPLGTMGAVIGMQGSRANRKQLFDIGLTGPLAGLVVLMPIAWYGIKTAVAVPRIPNEMYFQDPLLFRLLIGYLRPDVSPGIEVSGPFVMAAWVGMMVTGLNMLPISQLDGGHTAYGLFGRRAHYLAWGVVGVAIVFMIWEQQPTFILMLALIFAIGVKHPPTADDRVELGWGRYLIGLVSLLIPIFCLSPNPISVAGQ